MSACTATDKPLISIVMAVYNPNLQWLREQLTSLNAQSYSCLELHILDDCSPNISFEEIQSCVQDCICAFPYSLSRNEKNLGSNKTFERLTAMATGEYIAYCDQDDVWLPEKLERLQAYIEQTRSLLACSDVTVIDGHGKHTADSITELRPRHRFCEGENLVQTFIYRNFVIGCTMLLDASVAKGSCPFPDCMVQDHYLAFRAAAVGRIGVYPQPLVRYRIHGGNQTGVLTGVCDHRSYYLERIQKFSDRVEQLELRVQLPALNQAQIWCNARKANWGRQRGGARALWHLRSVNRTTTLFEIVARRLPLPLFRLSVKLIQAGL